MNDLIVVGASGFGREVAWLVERINKKDKIWNLLGFLDDDEIIQNTSINSYPVLGKTCDIKKYNNAYCVVAVGSASVREKIVNILIESLPTVKFATLVDPSVLMSDLVEIGEGSIICANTILTVNIKIGNHVIINLGCTVGHDAFVDDFVTVYPSVNISGTVNVGCATELGTGTQIIQGIRIGDKSIIGAGATVVKDIPRKCTAVGSPAKPIKFFD